MENKKKKLTKIGSLWAGMRTFTQDDGSQISKNMVSIALGQSKNKDPKYNTTVEIIVRDSEGKVIHQQTDGFLNLLDPRDVSKTPEKVPAGLKYDVLASS